MFSFTAVLCREEISFDFIEAGNAEVVSAKIAGKYCQTCNDTQQVTYPK